MIRCNRAKISGASRRCEDFLRAHQAARAGPPIRRFAGWLAQDAPNATTAPGLAGSPAFPRPERWAQFPRTVAHSADILLPCSSRISPLCTLHDKWDQGTVPGGTVKANL